MIEIKRLNTMRMRSDDEIDSMVDQPTSEFALFISDVLAVFNSPVNQTDHEICVLPGIRNCGVQSKAIRCHGDWRARSRPNVIHRHKSDFFLIDHMDDTRCPVAAAGVCNCDWLDLITELALGAVLQRRGPEIERMIICCADGARSGAR